MAKAKQKDSFHLINDLSYGDFHIHSSTLSDGLNSIDDIALQAGKLGYEQITITDHSQAYMESYGFAKKTHYSIIASGRWQNIHNTVKVNFGVEGDLLSDNGDVCIDIQGITPGFVILSSHKQVYRGNGRTIKQGYLNAINRHGSRIDVLGHLCSRAFEEWLTAEDIIDITECANLKNVALELNCANLKNGKTNPVLLSAMLSCCKNLYVNSDAHTLDEFSRLRAFGFEYLHTKGYIQRHYDL